MLCNIIFLKGHPRVPAPNWRGPFWHVAVECDGKIYETFSRGRYRVTYLEDWPLIDEPMEIIPADIDKSKLISELQSGTDCATYVARLLGMSKTTGPTKDDIYPIDIYIYLKQRSL